MAASADSLFDFPEADELLEALLNGLVAESDRGAVLVGAAHVDFYLSRLFRDIAPTELSASKRNALLSYPGPLSTLSAKVEVAYAGRLIGRELYQSINVLRKLRNEVAHEPKNFQLSSQMGRVRSMYRLGPDVPTAINRTAIEIMMREKIERVLDIGKRPEMNRPPFTSPQEVIDFIAASPALVEKLDRQLPRYELAMAVAVICALLAWIRERTTLVIGDRSTISALSPGTSSSGGSEEETGTANKSEPPATGGGGE